VNKRIVVIRRLSAGKVGLNSAKKEQPLLFTATVCTKSVVLKPGINLKQAQYQLKKTAPGIGSGFVARPRVELGTSAL
jgi:hypothetical protein